MDARNFGGTKSTYGCDVTAGLINYEIVSHDEDRDSFVGDSEEELERDAKNYIRDLFKYAGLKDLQKKVEKASQKNESKNTPKSKRITESRKSNKRILKEYFEWSEGYEDVAEAKELLKDMEFLASLDGLSDLEIMEAVKEEVTENYINNQDIGSHDDLDFGAFLDSVAVEFINLLNAPII